MSFLNNKYGLLSLLNQHNQPSQLGSGLETPAQIDQVITKSIAKKRKMKEPEPEDDDISNEELYKAFQNLQFTTKRASKRKNKNKDEEFDATYGGSIQSF